MMFQILLILMIFSYSGNPRFLYSSFNNFNNEDIVKILETKV